MPKARAIRLAIMSALMKYT